MDMSLIAKQHPLEYNFIQKKLPTLSRSTMNPEHKGDTRAEQNARTDRITTSNETGSHRKPSQQLLPCTTNGTSTTLPESTIPPTNSNQTRKVSFHPAVSVRRTIHINNYTKKEIFSSWYGEHEYSVMRENISFSSILVSKGLLNEDTEHYCRRGIECHVSERTMLQRLKVKMAAWVAVFNEQELAHQEDNQEKSETVEKEAESSTSNEVTKNPPLQGGQDVTERIARAYRAVSCTATSIAHAAAIDDELEASRYYHQHL